MTRITAVAIAAMLAMATLAAPGARAYDMMVGDLMMIHPTARPNMPNRPTAAYVTVANDGETMDRLIAVASPDFESAEIHNVEMTDGVMKMFPVDGIDIRSILTVSSTMPSTAASSEAGLSIRLKVRICSTSCRPRCPAARISSRLVASSEPDSDSGAESSA